jgi:excisionase family DNA binding protein
MRKSKDHVKRAGMPAMFVDPESFNQYPPILTVGQAASLLQVPKSTIYEWSSRGLLDRCARKVGRYLRISRDALIIEFFG